MSDEYTRRYTEIYLEAERLRGALEKMAAWVKTISSPSFPQGLPELRTEALARKESAKPCPWCMEDPGLAREIRPGWYTVGCESDDCAVTPQVSAQTLNEVWRLWNTRVRACP